MAYDIYGNHLHNGNCEVHPWITEEYPCYVCRQQDLETQRQRKMEKQMYDDMQKDILAHEQNEFAKNNSQEYCTLLEKEDELKSLLTEIRIRKDEIIKEIVPF